MDHKLIILFILLYSSFIYGKTSAKTYLKIEQSNAELTEQIALVLYPDKAILSMNTNQWSSENLIGKFEIKDPKVLKEIDKNITLFYYKYAIPKDTYEKHQAVLTIDKKRIPPNTSNYANALNYIKEVMKYKWVALDSMAVVKKSKKLTGYAIEKKKAVPIECRLRSTHSICLSKYGIIYTNK